jgi:hypothetical protein
MYISATVSLGMNEKHSMEKGVLIEKVIMIGSDKNVHEQGRSNSKRRYFPLCDVVYSGTSKTFRAKLPLPSSWRRTKSDKQ